MEDLAERRVLVTGASSGIGAATARACAARGARVAVLARRAQALETLAAEIGGAAFAADVTDEQATRAAVDAAADALGGIDALVNNAGVMRPSLVAEGKVEDWRAMFDVNVLGLLLATHAALPHLRASDRADIVNVSSLSGRRVPNAPAGVYAATKHAVHALSEGLRQELGGDGVRVTVIAPGLVDTDLLDGDEHAAAARIRERAAQLGLTAADVGSAVADALAQPPHVLIRELVLSPTAQTS
jgi:NADP-dependent 3-hydroxy acid dehydrogenase YdfG